MQIDDLSNMLFFISLMNESGCLASPLPPFEGGKGGCNKPKNKPATPGAADA